MDRVLDRLNDESVNVQPGEWGTNSVAGLIVHKSRPRPHVSV